MSRAACAAASGAAQAMAAAKSVMDTAERDITVNKESDRVFDDATADKIAQLSLRYTAAINELFEP